MPDMHHCKPAVCGVIMYPRYTLCPASTRRGSFYVVWLPSALLETVMSDAYAPTCVVPLQLCVCHMYQLTCARGRGYSRRCHLRRRRETRAPSCSAARRVQGSEAPHCLHHVLSIHGYTCITKLSSLQITQKCIFGEQLMVICDLYHIVLSFARSISMTSQYQRQPCICSCLEVFDCIVNVVANAWRPS